MMTWILLTISIVIEVIATSLLNASAGFTRPWHTAGALSLYALSFYFASKVMTMLPVGIVYAIWSGMGIVLISAVGVIWFKQKLDVAAIIGIALIISGVAVINLFSKSSVH
ncbi:DMT family transporter [Conservatibacter flavescens]|uniref:QacE family quaternary ammonium compound efflux SMR transporter n=1 Tax=Conservatibacter flavescens TaxID=28161 RepID=A0A2M8S2Z9_9PAST|nr:SMR family transporter [Conservatibacter flavescens]PJG85530.1 QacE family quaternary ammonium compound efflux SMR transporter [Conservatibacter flavescens]